MTRSSEVGFNQRIQLEWMELAAQLVLRGMTRDDIESQLQQTLRDKLSVGNDPTRGNRDKAITILVRTWVTPRADLQPLRDDALVHLADLPTEHHLLLHWGMAMCAYPFFGMVAEAVGRHLRLQGRVSAIQVQRHMREQLGERETVARAARRVLRSFVDWQVLVDTEMKGIYTQSPVLEISDPALRGWMVEAVLRGSSTPVAALQTVMQSPALFPFSTQPASPYEIDRCPRLDWFRQGLDQDMVTLRVASLVSR